MFPHTEGNPEEEGSSVTSKDTGERDRASHVVSCVTRIEYPALPYTNGPPFTSTEHLRQGAPYWQDEPRKHPPLPGSVLADDLGDTLLAAG